MASSVRNVSTLLDAAVAAGMGASLDAGNGGLAGMGASLDAAVAAGLFRVPFAGFLHGGAGTVDAGFLHGGAGTVDAPDGWVPLESDVTAEAAAITFIWLSRLAFFFSSA